MNWKLKTLDELGFVRRGKSRHRPRNAEHLYGGIYPLIQTGDIQKANFYINEYSQTYSEDGLEQSKLWKEGTMVISIVGANTADTAILGFDACFPDSVIGFITYENEENVKIVKYNLECIKVHLKSVSEGTARENLSLEKLLSIKILTPPFSSQCRIASILYPYDDLIENNLKRIKLLEEGININYKKLISNKDEGFTMVKLNSIVEIISGFPFKSNYYNENGKHKIVTIKNVQDGFFVPTVTDRIDDIPDNMNNSLFLTTGDIIMSLTGNVGRVCLVYGDDYILNQRVVKLSAKELIDQSLIYALFRDKQMLAILENLANGAAQQNLSPIKMGELIIRYPNSSLREDFYKIVSPMVKMICKLKIQNTKLREARDILLPKLMNGQIEV